MAITVLSCLGQDYPAAQVGLEHTQWPEAATRSCWHIRHDHVTWPHICHCRHHHSPNSTVTVTIQNITTDLEHFCIPV